MLNTNGSLERLVQDDRLLWSDALSFGGTSLQVGAHR
jgi:hypothetical protein